MGVLLIICAIYVFWNGYNNPSLLALALYPCAVVALLAGIGLCLQKSKIKALTKRLDDLCKLHDDAMESIDEEQEEQNKTVTATRTEMQKIHRGLSELQTLVKQNLNNDP